VRFSTRFANFVEWHKVKEKKLETHKKQQFSLLLVVNVVCYKRVCAERGPL